MSLPATKRPPRDFKELKWQSEQNWQSGNKPLMNSRSSNKHGPAKTIVLPFYSGTSTNFSRYVEVGSNKRTKSGQMRLKAKKAKPIIPGWLVELKDYYLRGVMNIKSILEEGNQRDIRSLVKSLGKVIREDMDIEITDVEIFHVLKSIPLDCEGCYSFPHFMFGIGNPVMAQKSGVFMLNEHTYDPKVEMEYRRMSNDMSSKGQDQSSGDQYREGGGEEGKGTDNVVENSNKGQHKSPPDPNDPNSPDDTGYNLREKVFYSGLLIFEMYETLNHVENLYILSKIPEPPNIILERDRQRGFGIENIGHQNMKEAAWDKPLPPLPKLSPYLSSVPFVTTRWNTTKSAPNAKLKRTFSKLQQLHLAIRPPRQENSPVCITENQARVRQALAYLAGKGDCVALLPDIHFVIHLSDTDVDKLDIVTIRECTEFSPCKVSHIDEKALVMHEIKKLYLPLILPRQITKLTSKITYADGLQLREICRHMQREHWNAVSQRKLDFREKVWAQSYVDDMPLGQLRDSFIYAFVTYLPYVSHLPMYCTNCY